jgi:hypothetical protein
MTPLFGLPRLGGGPPGCRKHGAAQGARPRHVDSGTARAGSGPAGDVGDAGMETHAIAASSADVARQGDRSDEIQDQEDAIDAAQNMNQARQATDQEVPSAPKEFNFRISAPLYYSSNATQVRSGRPAALELDTEIELGRARSLTSVPLKLSVRLKADTDRYVNVPQANGNEASGSIKAVYYDVNNDEGWTPFISYRGMGIYDSTFSPQTEARNDFALGFDKRLNSLFLNVREMVR